MPGWETERMGEIKELFQKYKGVTEDDLVENLRHFLRRIAPVCEDCGIKMAIHPDDPPWGIFGLPRIIKNTADLERLLSLVDSDINGITFCTGSLGASKDNDLPAMIRKFRRQDIFRASEKCPQTRRLVQRDLPPVLGRLARHVRDSQGSL